MGLHFWKGVSYPNRLKFINNNSAHFTYCNRDIFREPINTVK